MEKGVRMKKWENNDSKLPGIGGGYSEERDSKVNDRGDI